MLTLFMSIILAILIYHIGRWLIDIFGMEEIIVIAIIAMIVFTLLRCH